MAIRREGGDVARMCLIGFNIFSWAAGIALIIIGIWMLVDPTRSYILDLVNFSEDDPLLVFASYTCIFTGIGTLFVAFVSCCGAMKRIRCILVTLMTAMVILFCCGIAIGVLGLLFQNKVHSSTVTSALRFMIRNEYGVLTHLERNERVTTLIDKMQYHLECCGVASHRDWKTSNWAVDGGGGDEDGRTLYREQPSEYLAVPHTCCKQQKCCGGDGPTDYYNSFWFITNTDRGTRSFVPTSCCHQTQSARAWSINPIDPLCTIYHYQAKVFNDVVYTEGCGPKLYRWFSDQTTIFAVVGFSFAALQVIGIIIALCMCSQVKYYHYVKSEVYD